MQYCRNIGLVVQKLISLIQNYRKCYGLHLFDPVAEKNWNYFYRLWVYTKKVLSCEIWTRLFNQNKQNQNNKLIGNPGFKHYCCFEQLAPTG